jgi:hypothetical protein
MELDARKAQFTSENHQTTYVLPNGTKETSNELYIVHISCILFTEE